MREQKSPRAWVKTARRWDIIGRGIGMGWFRCSPSCVAKGPTFPSPARVQPRKFRKRGATWKWTRKEGGRMTTLAAPLNGLANHAKPEIGSDFGGFAADRGRL